MMPTTLHLGVLDVPYTEGGKTTGDVAEILEDKYHVMWMFFALHGQEIIDRMTDGLVRDMENRAMGAPEGQDPFAGAMSYGETLFRTFLEQKELDGMVEGVPTAASLAGVSHRFKRKKGAPGRPSFVDTGQFSAAFKMWADAQG